MVTDFLNNPLSGAQRPTAGHGPVCKDLTAGVVSPGEGKSLKRQQLSQSVLRPLRQARQYVRQPGMWLQTITLCCFQKTHYLCRAFAGHQRACE